MDSKPRKSTSLFSSGNIAFVIVVCAAYASATTAMIYARRPVPPWEIAVPASTRGSERFDIAASGDDPNLRVDLPYPGHAAAVAQPLG